MRKGFGNLEELQELRNNHMHMIIHDLRSPLTGLIGMVDLLESSLKDQPISESQTYYLNNAKRSVNSIREMVDLALDIFKMEEGSHDLILEELDLMDTVKEASDLVSGMNKNKKLEVIENYPVFCICDKMIIVRVVTNLLSNAIKFTPPGGKIVISVAYDNGFAIIKVIDTGSGVPKEYQQDIFKKFKQVKTEQHVPINSTGLGLTFCKWAVEAHGGDIGVESNHGEGATFWFRIPLKGAL